MFSSCNQCNRSPVRIFRHRCDGDTFPQYIFSGKTLCFLEECLTVFGAIHPVQSDFKNAFAGSNHERISIDNLLDQARYLCGERLPRPTEK